MKRNIIAVTPEYISPKELSHRLKSMAVLDIVMNPEEEDWLRRVQKFPSEKESYNIQNGSGDEMVIFFEENGVFIRGFDHESDLNQFAADEWDEDFFTATYAGIPQNFLEIYLDEEENGYMTFCMWYDYKAECWKQNITVGEEGGKKYLLGFICADAAAWAEWAQDYYEQEINLDVVKKVYAGSALTKEDICLLNPGRDAQAALQEIRTYGLGEDVTIYYRDNEILIRNLQGSDAQIITDGEIEQGWDAHIDKYLTRLKDQAENRAIALAAEYRGNVAGYINVYPDSKWGAFANQGYPEIVDFGVLEKYRRHGIGGKLMDVAEKVAAEYADVVYLGVGLHSGYGSAQRMYVKRGYIPDGSGVWYKDTVCAPYADCCNDDDLVLYFSKKLR